MRYLCITDGMLAENCYLLLDEASGEAAVIDPGFVNDRLLGEIAKYKVRWILLTHGHFDHIEGVDRLRALTGAGQAMASNILSLPVGGILKCGVIGPDPPTQPTPTVRPAALPLPLNLADPDIRLTLALDAVNTGGGTSYKIGHGLKVEDGTLMVDTADAVEQDNTLPVTSAAVFVQTGNIEALLAAL